MATPVCNIQHLSGLLKRHGILASSVSMKTQPDGDWLAIVETVKGPAKLRLTAKLLKNSSPKQVRQALEDQIAGVAWLLSWHEPWGTESDS